jgi:NACHT domain
MRFPSFRKESNAIQLWGVRLCSWLWKASGFIGTVVVLSLSVNLLSTWLTSPKGIIPRDSPFGRLIMNWPITLLVGICLLLLAVLFWAMSRWQIHPGTLPLPDQADRERMVRRLRLHYTNLLEQSLQGAALLELGLSHKPTAVHNATTLLARLPNQSEQPLPAGTSILHAFDKVEQELLILGEPGAGKSTLLLELAQQLVERASQDYAHPLPVILPLSSWAVKHLPLQDWLSEQLTLIYAVPRRLSQQWVHGEHILPLLDGLDEMEVSAQVACIKVINTYYREHLRPLVVCSRAVEYDAASQVQRLILQGAVVVQPLTVQQVDDYLVQGGKPLVALRSTLKKNAVLLDLATAPLMLSVLILTYHGRAIGNLKMGSPQEQQQQIFTNYVQRMLEQKGNVARYPFQQTIAWLGWLARQMRDHNRSIFSLEQMQPDWLPKKRRPLYRWSVVLAFALAFVPASGEVVGVIFPPIILLLSAMQLSELLVNLVLNLVDKGLLVVGLVFALKRIQPAEGLSWSWKKALVTLAFVSVFVLVCILVFGLSGGPIYATSFWVQVNVLPIIPPTVLVIGLTKKQLTERLSLSPNEGIHRSAKNGLFLGLAIVMTSEIFIGLNFLWPNIFGKDPSVSLVDVLLGGMTFLLPVGLAVGLIVGLGAAVQHYILRFWLWRSHLFPLDAVHFLDDATSRILLRHVGGGYSFVHGLLLDYFADLDSSSSSTPTGAQTTGQPLPVHISRRKSKT